MRGGIGVIAWSIIVLLLLSVTWTTWKTRQILMESEGSGSLQSKKALASALDLDINDLEFQEIVMPQKWEYKVVETKDRAELQPELAGFGAEGWELVSATAMFNTMMTKVVYTLFLKRPTS